jgi:cytidylate kinase
MRDLVLVTGPPGAGKSTASNVLADMFDPSALVAGDDFYRFLKVGYVAPWLAEAHEQNTAVTEAAAAAAGRLCAHCWVVYDGVVGPWLLPAFVRGTGLDRVHYVVLLPPSDVCLERVRTRVGHGFVDLPAARHMYQQFAGAPLDDRHLIGDQHSNPAGLAALIHEGVGTGRFAYHAR